MSLVGARRSLLAGGLNREKFRRSLLVVLGDCRLLWLARQGDTTTSVSVETSSGRVITWDGDVSSRLTAFGGFGGAAQSFAVASSQYGDTPDTANLSFGNGTVDTPFSIIALANVTDTAGLRTFVSKWDNTAREWIFRVGATDLLQAVLTTSALNQDTLRTSDAAITQGSWRLFGMTYTAATGGATAGDDITLYQDGAVIASTATNNALYAAMSDKDSPAEIGSLIAHTLHFFDGSMALVAVTAKALTAADHAAVAALCRRMFGVPL